MPVIEWSDKYKTGIPDIDAEHRNLFALINGLHDEVAAGSADSSIEATFGALAAYVKHHFAREESLMAACKYNGLESHKAEHARLKRRFEDFRKAHENDPETFDMTGFAEFLARWLQDHILRSDMAYVPYVQYRVDTVVGYRVG